MEIVDLIENVRVNIEDNKIRKSDVGNRPHYPVFVSFNGSNSKKCSAFINNIQNTWSSKICKQLLFYRYENNDTELRFLDIYEDKTIPDEEVKKRISDALKKSDVIAEYDKWCYYNIIDTSELSFDEFKTAFDSLERFRSKIRRRTLSMVVVIINDDEDKDDTNYQIRDFLRNESIYDGIILVSNIARGGFGFDSEDLYKIISNLVLLSNNDAVTGVDDKLYNERIRKIYSKTPLIMSYNSLCKPTNDILSCMIQCLVSKVSECIDDTQPKNFSSKDIEAILGVENRKIVTFESFVQRAKQKIIQELNYQMVFQYMPLVSPNVFNDKDIESKTIGQLSGIDFESLTLISKDICKGYIESEEGKKIFEDYTKHINDNLNLMNITDNLEENLLDKFAELFDNRMPDKSNLPRVYLSQLIIYLLNSQFIYPYCIKLAKKICNAEEIESTKENIYQFIQNTESEIPVTGFDEIATFYGMNMSKYLQTEKGKACISKILNVGNTYNDICGVVEDTLYNANEFCNEEIKLPFIYIWAKALKLHDDEIFGRIRNTLYGDGDKAILLRGTYPVNEELSIYMLHCYDRNGENETELYKQFRKAYKDIPNVQFFNTGNDDSIESIKLYKCSGTSLILMDSY